MSQPPASAARRGRLVVMSGPSGSGKTTIKERLRRHPDVRVAVTVTTRAPRKDEQDGRDYHFVTREEFLRRKAAGEFAETNDVFGTGTLYGSLRAEIDEALAEPGRVLLIEVDVTGARNLRRAGYEGVYLFIAPPDMAQLESRLRRRGTDDAAAIDRRLQRARDEMDEARADGSRLVINNDLEQAVREVFAAAGLAEVPART
ncbi:MAG TPA: guanylate kinase [Planctomycetota bacterium]|nr:guanylate kinase [Planctomycetota bacterium]